MFKLLLNTQRFFSPSFSSLYSHETFHKAFSRDLGICKRELIIESPFITKNRMSVLMPLLRKLRQRDVKIVVNTRHPDEHDNGYDKQALDAIADMQAIGIKVLYTKGHHRKLAIIDRRIVWEGSLNILSFNDSCEIMRKIESEAAAEQMIAFIAINRYL